MADKITLTKLRLLEDDWDDHGSPKPSEEAVEMAERILTMLRNEEGHASALEDGGVQLEWNAGGIDIEIVITAEGTLDLE